MSEIKAVTAKNVVKEFKTGLGGDTIRIINDVSFELDVGEHMAIIGPNGCGKTSLLKTLATLYRHDGGQIKIYDLDLMTQEKEIRKISSFVSPMLDFQKKLTLNECLKFYAGVQDVKVEGSTALHFIDEMEMESMLPLRLEGFSAGQKAVVRLAIGLLKNPKLMLLDEVTANLDIDRKEKVIKYLEEYAVENEATYLIVDHDPEVVDRLCHSMLLLKRGGTVLKKGTVDEILSDIDYAMDIRVVTRRKVTDEIAESVGYRWIREGGTVRYFLPNEDDVDVAVKNIIEIIGENLINMELSGISLEDVYIYWFSLVSKEEEEVEVVKEKKFSSFLDRFAGMKRDFYGLKQDLFSPFSDFATSLRNKLKRETD